MSQLDKQFPQLRPFQHLGFVGHRFHLNEVRIFARVAHARARTYQVLTRAAHAADPSHKHPRNLNLVFPPTLARAAQVALEPFLCPLASPLLFVFSSRGAHRLLRRTLQLLLLLLKLPVFYVLLNTGLHLRVFLSNVEWRRAQPRVAATCCHRHLLRLQHQRMNRCLSPLVKHRGAVRWTDG
jgi:hypothetical protein